MQICGILAPAVLPMEETYFRMFGPDDPLIPKYQSPLEEGDHPELDT